MNKVGTVRQEFIEFAKRAEQRIVSIATGVYNFILERIAHDRQEAEFSELTALLKEDVRFKVDRCGIRSLAQPSFARLHATAPDKILNATIIQTLEKVYDATEKLEKNLEK